ncbi:hypothetical protein [Streptomyces sp. NPDC058657]|uniref:hypothetical protein n=1 Tax=unclassified Streptomyces TaxID=2593676 RepID=UPI00366679BE
MPRTTRLTPWCAFAALVAVVFGLLCTPATAAPADFPGGGPAYVKVVDTPGCDRAPVHQDGTHPATPPRGSTAYDLLPVLCTAARPAAVHRSAAADLSSRPRRGPPVSVPATPVELSVLLRV